MEPRRHWRQGARSSHSGRLCTTLRQPVVRATRIVSTLSPVVPAPRAATSPRISEWSDIAEGVVCGGRLPKAASQTHLVPQMMDRQHERGRRGDTHLRPPSSCTSPLCTVRKSLLNTLSLTRTHTHTLAVSRTHSLSGVQELGFGVGVWGLGFGLWSFGLRFWVLGFVGV